jgi:ligand-binding sensor domain-containing protein
VLTYGVNYKFYPKTGKNGNMGILPGYKWNCRYNDHAGNIWCTVEQGNCYKYNPRTNTFEVSNLNYPGFVSTWDHYGIIHRDLGVGTTEGLWLKQPRMIPFPYFQFKASAPDEGLSRSTVMHMAENKEGLWLASSIGLFLVDLQSGVKAVY